MTDDTVRLVRATPSEPLLIQGPVRIEMPGGATVESERFMSSRLLYRPTNRRSDVEGAAESCR